MGDLGALADQLITLTGETWFAAVIASFFVMICESAKPKPGEGEPKHDPGGLGVWVMILSLLTPLLLMVHAFVHAGRAPDALIAAVVVIGAAVMGAAIIGWIIALVSPAMGRVLARAAPFIAVAVFALTLWVTWRSAFELLNIYVLRHAS